MKSLMRITGVLSYILHRLLSLCARHGLTCAFFMDYDLWGAQRDAVIARARVVSGAGMIETH
jgi:hypothetical protein